MANSATITSQINASINGLTINQSGQLSTIPSGSTAIGESTFLTPSAYTLIATGSNFGNLATLAVYNTSTGSISIQLSASGVVNNLGVVAGLANTASLPSSPSQIQWNQPFTALYASGSSN